MNILYKDKNELRAKAKALRDTLNSSDYAEQIVKNIFEWSQYQKSQNIMIFYPINSEISLLPLLKKKTKNIYFPITDQENIKPVKYDSFSGFSKGKYGILEPVGPVIKDLNEIDIIFLPALAADKKGYRLGYGKGYYDRFLKQVSQNAIKVIPIYSQLVYDSIPKETHDMPADYLITEQGIYLI